MYIAMLYVKAKMTFNRCAVFTSIQVYKRRIELGVLISDILEFKAIFALLHIKTIKQLLILIKLSHINAQTYTGLMK